jgi:hypothetical protein
MRQRILPVCFYGGIKNDFLLRALQEQIFFNKKVLAGK